MKERPMMFNAEMVRALLENRKGQTRRVVGDCNAGNIETVIKRCRYGQVGDRLGAIEASEYVRAFRHDMPEAFAEEWKGHVFQWLEITAIRVERLQDISGEDAIAEGVDCQDPVLSDLAFMKLWDAIYQAPKDWDSNPWVFVVCFKRLEGGAE